MRYTEEQIDKIVAENRQLKQELAQVKAQVAYLLRKLFGKSSEKMNPDQLELLFKEFAVLAEEAADDSNDDAENEEKQRSKTRGKRKPFDEHIPENLPIERTELIPDEVLANPEDYEKIGEDVRQELVIVPNAFFVRETVRPKFKKKTDKNEPPIQEKAPETLIPTSYASPELLVDIIISKYCDHLPLYRQSDILMRRYGIDISRKTMGHWMYLMANWLTIIYEAIRAEVRLTDYMQIDETPIKYIKPGNGSCLKGYLWVYYAPTVDAVFFEWFASRANECLDPMLKDFFGLIQTDDYAAYGAFYKRPEHAAEAEQIIHAACWVHARRKFFEAMDDPVAAKVIREIQKLYQIESKLTKHPELDRSSVRQEEATPVLDTIKTILEEEQPRQLPKSKIGEAISYTLNLWDKLTVYVDHSELQIDNNLVENAIRPSAIGKKNWLHFGSSDSGQISAVLYTVLENCRRLDINPEEYLLELFRALPEMQVAEAADWTPSRWLARRKEADIALDKTA